jgi:hypothetical protein
MKNIRLNTEEKIATAINKIYEMLQSREINPSGEFDDKGRFYLKKGHLVNVRGPSKAWPNSELNAGRTKKYIKAVYQEAKPKTLKSLIKEI